MCEDWKRGRFVLFSAMVSTCPTGVPLCSTPETQHFCMGPEDMVFDELVHKYTNLHAITMCTGGVGLSRLFIPFYLDSDLRIQEPED